MNRKKCALPFCATFFGDIQAYIKPIIILYNFCDWENIQRIIALK